MSEALILNQLKENIGKEIGLSEWMEITQSRINAFADCTEDRQWIHVNEEMAKHSPFGTTIAHSFLILSLLSYFNFQNKLFRSGIKMAANYGLNRVRFINSVPVGSRIRNRAVLKEITEKGPGRILINLENTVEIEGQEKPAMKAEMLAMLFV
ncbi:MAG: MaoC family dehydratase [Candidatus Aminicenantes bacterium]|nr:MaoC family dehydratase [Candidatus Aminicenantes bacterium]